MQSQLIGLFHTGGFKSESKFDMIICGFHCVCVSVSVCLCVCLSVRPSVCFFQVFPMIWFHHQVYLWIPLDLAMFWKYLENNWNKRHFLMKYFHNKNFVIPNRYPSKYLPFLTFFIQNACHSKHLSFEKIFILRTLVIPNLTSASWVESRSEREVP